VVFVATVDDLRNIFSDDKHRFSRLEEMAPATRTFPTQHLQALPGRPAAAGPYFQVRSIDKLGNENSLSGMDQRQEGGAQDHLWARTEVPRERPHLSSWCYATAFPLRICVVSSTSRSHFAVDALLNRQNGQGGLKRKEKGAPKMPSREHVLGTEGFRTPPGRKRPI